MSLIIEYRTVEKSEVDPISESQLQTGLDLNNLGDYAWVFTHSNKSALGRVVWYV